MREATILLAAVLLGSVSTHPTTSEPDWAPTGRLSQFRGFATPRPTGIPENAQMMYASVWAAWSAWSFCSNGVRMRVRACNTVRGFSCLGSNQETLPCDAVLPPSGPNSGRGNTDYDVVDPWESDRREAMKQLYPDDPLPPSEVAGKNFAEISRGHPPSPNRLSIDHELVGFEGRRPVNEADGSPGTDPEKLFGARQFAVKTMKADEHKEMKHKEFDETNELLVPMGAHPQNSEGETLNSESFEDITFDTTTPEQKRITTTTTATTTTEIITEETTSVPLESKVQGPQGPRRGFGITVSSKGELRVFPYKFGFKKKNFRSLWRKSSENLRKLLGINEKKEKESGSYFIPAFSEDSLWPSALMSSDSHEKPPAAFGNGFSFDFIPFEKKERRIKKNLHSGESEEATKRIRKELEKISLAMDTTKTRLEQNRIFLHSSEDQKKKRKAMGVKGREASGMMSQIQNLLQLQKIFNNKDRKSKELALAEAIEKSFTEPLSESKKSKEDKGGEMIDGSFEEAEIIGENPIRVQPTLPPNAIDDNLEDLLEVTENENPLPTEPPVTATEEVVRVNAETGISKEKPQITLPVAETDILNQINGEERTEMKVISPWNGKKRKGFGITGFAVKKSREEKEEKTGRVHDGEVARIRIERPRVTETTTTTTTEAPVTSTETRKREEEDISIDTLNALDWMLKNMTQAAAKEDTEFLHKFVSEVGIAPREEISLEKGAHVTEMKTYVPIQPVQPSAEEQQVPVAPQKSKSKKKKKTTKGKKTRKEFKPAKLHSGEFSPLRKSKMFPKFKARQMKVGRTRALGVRTVSSDKDRVEAMDREKLMAGVENPEKIYEEIRQLQAEMQQMEKQLADLNSSEQKEISLAKSLNDPLIHSSHGLEDTKIVSKPIQKKKSEDISSTLVSVDPLRILTSVEENIETKWSEWSEWGNCFCGKQIRTRNCVFGSNSDGCEGPSHETRECSGGECPSSAHSAEVQRTGVLSFNPDRHRSRPHRLP